jgi:hypothetical protein
MDTMEEPRDAKYLKDKLEASPGRPNDIRRYIQRLLAVNKEANAL